VVSHSTCACHRAERLLRRRPLPRAPPGAPLCDRQSCLSRLKRSSTRAAQGIRDLELLHLYCVGVPPPPQAGSRGRRGLCHPSNPSAAPGANPVTAPGHLPPPRLGTRPRPPELWSWLARASALSRHRQPPASPTLGYGWRGRRSGGLRQRQRVRRLREPTLRGGYESRHRGAARGPPQQLVAAAGADAALNLPTPSSGDSTRVLGGWERIWGGRGGMEGGISHR
jgi:hypothetical protein